MAVLHITYKPAADIDHVAYEGFGNVLATYESIRLSKSNWTINTEEAPKTVWQKLKPHIKPYDYIVMYRLDARLLTSQDKKILQWILSRP